MPEPIINFTYNWNGKLYCKFFLTIRLKNDHKYQPGRSFHIQFNGKDLGPGVIKIISHSLLSQISPAIAFLDMGYPLEDFKKVFITMYKNKNINWATQQLSMLLIEMPEKIIPAIPDEMYGVWVDAPETEAEKAEKFPKSLFTKS